MANTLKSIVAKLNDTMRTNLEGAAGLCLSRTHYDVEIEHFLSKLLDASGTDFAGCKLDIRARVDESKLVLSRSADRDVVEPCNQAGGFESIDNGVVALGTLGMARSGVMLAIDGVGQQGGGGLRGEGLGLGHKCSGRIFQ